jgi:hypothetical protein
MVCGGSAEATEEGGGVSLSTTGAYGDGAGGKVLTTELALTTACAPT